MHLFWTDAGKLYKREPGSLVRTEVSLPAGTVQRSPFTRMSHVVIPGQRVVIFVGQFYQNLIWRGDTGQLLTMGIAAPTTAPTLAASGTGVTGVVTGRYTFAHVDADGVVVAESNMSPASNTLSLVNQGRLWTGFETTHTNARVNRIRLYISVDGDEYLHVPEEDIILGTASTDENVATNELDQETPGSMRRGVPPGFKYITYYANRAWGATGDDDSFRFSELDELESWPAVNELKTRDGRRVTSLKALSDQVVIGTRSSIQDVQGYSADDFNVRILTQDIGIISNGGAIVINDKLWFPSQDGYYRYGGGGFQFLMPNLRTYFREAYEADPQTYQDLVVAIDRRRHILKVLVPGEDSITRHPFYYVAHYLPCETEFGGVGGLPYWAFDERDNFDRTIGTLSEDGELLDRLYTGSCDGLVRLEDVAGNQDDDEDGAVDFEVRIVTKHFLPTGQGGDDAHTPVFGDLDVHVKSEDKAFTVSTYTGDDSATDAAEARWVKAEPASAATKQGRPLVAKTSHNFKTQNGAGKGGAVKITCTSPTVFEYRGIDWEFEPIGGNQTRDKT